MKQLTIVFGLMLFSQLTVQYASSQMAEETRARAVFAVG
jgi:hypothetical protein